MKQWSCPGATACFSPHAACACASPPSCSGRICRGGDVLSASSCGHCRQAREADAPPQPWKRPQPALVPLHHLMGAPVDSSCSCRCKCASCSCMPVPRLACTALRPEAAAPFHLRPPFCLDPLAPAAPAVPVCETVQSSAGWRCWPSTCSCIQLRAAGRHTCGLRSSHLPWTPLTPCTYELLQDGTCSAVWAVACAPGHPVVSWAEHGIAY